MAGRTFVYETFAFPIFLGTVFLPFELPASQPPPPQLRMAQKLFMAWLPRRLYILMGPQCTYVIKFVFLLFLCLTSIQLDQPKEPVRLADKLPSPTAEEKLNVIYLENTVMFRVKWHVACNQVLEKSLESIPHVEERILYSAINTKYVSGGDSSLDSQAPFSHFQVVPTLHQTVYTK